MTEARLKYLEELVENMGKPHGGIDNDEEDWKKVYPSDVKELIQEIRKLRNETTAYYQQVRVCPDRNVKGRVR